ncbi:flagella synthesis protein FlgN [uncultured Shewanella sp.]|uniref:flagella synthesis protein FlgN n=1 Tax=uncultured Shewanella sp. TaxID=173975 RepID=UPI0026218DCC|nr:flagellar protein FlgN [uncultured Shewanella sp.]
MEDLHSQLHLQQDMLVQLQTLLTQEKEAVIHKKADLLLSLCNEKAALLAKIKHHDKMMARHPNIALLLNEPSLEKQLQHTQALLTQCQQLNSENASIVAFNQASLNRFSQALQVSRNAASLTYNEKGKTSTASSLGNNIKV